MRLPLFCSVVLMCLSSAAPAADALRPDHPLLGTWALQIPNRACVETYEIRADGTTLVTSASEIAVSEFTISDKPSEKGFYKWDDKIVKDNGGKDCSGQVTKPGKKVTLFLRFHPSGKLFVLCEKEDLKSCFGPFVRQEEQAI